MHMESIDLASLRLVAEQPPRRDRIVTKGGHDNIDSDHEYHLDRKHEFLVLRMIHC